MMKKSGKQVLLFGGILIVAFAVWTALIQMVDVQPLGQNGTNIGYHYPWSLLCCRDTGIFDF